MEEFAPKGSVRIAHAGIHYTRNSRGGWMLTYQGNRELDMDQQDMILTAIHYRRLGETFEFPEPLPPYIPEEYNGPTIADNVDAKASAEPVEEDYAFADRVYEQRRAAKLLEGPLYSHGGICVSIR